MRITDIPTSSAADYRSYKLQFQAPASPGYFTWKLFLISDTFVGEEIAQDIAVRLNDSNLFR